MNGRRRLVAALTGIVAVVTLALSGCSLLPHPEGQAARGPGLQVAGPRNLATLGMRFVERGGDVVPLTGPALPAHTPPREPSAPSGVKQVVVYLDLSCPACRVFEQNALDWILERTAAGEATLELRPIAILDRSYQVTHYSPRINAVAAVIADRDPDRFLDFVRAAYAAQPDESSAGLTQPQIVALARSAGVTDAAALRDIRSERFVRWIESATQYALGEEDVQGTPSISVNGEDYPLTSLDLEPFRDFYATA